MIPLILDADVFPAPLAWPFMHPQRWWWRNDRTRVAIPGVVTNSTDDVRHWRRDDSRTVVMPAGEPTRDAVDEALAAYDEQHPMACPQPRIGMVIQLALDDTMTEITAITNMRVDIRGKVRGIMVAGFNKPLPAWPLPGMRILSPTPWGGEPLPQLVAPAPAPKPARPRLVLPGES